MNKKILLFFFALIFLFAGNLFCKDLDLSSFTDGLLKNIQFSGTDDKSLADGSSSMSTSQPTELSIVFENYSLIYTKINYNNYNLKFAYFSPEFINNTFGVDVSKYTAKDFEKIFYKPSLPSIDAGFDTIGYATKYKDKNINLYLYFSKNTSANFQFVRFDF